MGMLVLIKGAGDMASGAALRLYRAGFDVAMTDMEKPTAIRRTVCFSEAIRLGQTHAEDVLAKSAYDAKEARRLMSKRIIPVIADEDCSIKNELLPDVLVDAVLAKRNINTKIDDAGIVIALGPGFCAGRDCHAVIETQRGHNLGRVIKSGSAAPNTGIPGIIAGYGAERVLRAPADGLFMPKKSIGDIVKAGDCVAEVSDEPMLAAISGVLRGLLPEGSSVHKGMKSGDIDPRGIRAYRLTVSDKSMAVAGGVLEAILSLSRRL